MKNCLIWPTFHNFLTHLILGNVLEILLFFIKHKKLSKIFRNSFPTLSFPEKRKIQMWFDFTKKIYIYSLVQLYVYFPLTVSPSGLHVHYQSIFLVTLCFLYHQQPDPWPSFLHMFHSFAYVVSTLHTLMMPFHFFFNTGINLDVYWLFLLIEH